MNELDGYPPRYIKVVKMYKDTATVCIGREIEEWLFQSVGAGECMKSRIYNEWVIPSKTLAMIQLKFEG